MEPDEIPGYESTVHPGPLKPVLFWYAPQQYVLINVLFNMYAGLMHTWRWILVFIVVHVTLALLWWYDSHLLPIILREVRYKRFYGTG
jgi:type IV secretory pathway TrbD component